VSRIVFIHLGTSAVPEGPEYQELKNQQYDLLCLEPGVAWVAQALSDRAETVVLNADLMSDQKLVSAAVGFSPTCVGFSSFSAGWPRTERIANCIRESLPNIPYIFGGWHVTMCGQASRLSILARYPRSTIVVGRGEGVSDILLDPERYTSTVVDGDNGVNVPHRYPFDVLVEPAGKPRLSYFGIPVNQRTASMVIRGGCTFGCPYCPSGQGLAPERSVDEIMDEIRRLIIEREANVIFFRDENLLLYPRTIEGLCRALIREGLNERVCFYSLGDVRLIDEALLRLMAHAGWTGLSVGVERPNDQSMRALGRVQHLDTTRRSFEIMRSVGIFTVASIMLWCPGDTMETFDLFQDLLQTLCPDQIIATFFTPFPGFSNEDPGIGLRTHDLSQYHYLCPILVNDPSVTDVALHKAKQKLLDDYYGSTAFARLMRSRRQQLGPDRFRLLTEIRHQRLLSYGVDIMH